MELSLLLFLFYLALSYNIVLCLSALVWDICLPKKQKFDNKETHRNRRTLPLGLRIKRMWDQIAPWCVEKHKQMFASFILSPGVMMPLNERNYIMLNNNNACVYLLITDNNNSIVHYIMIISFLLVWNQMDLNVWHKVSNFWRQRHMCPHIIDFTNAMWHVWVIDGWPFITQLAYGRMKNYSRQNIVRVSGRVKNSHYYNGFMINCDQETLEYSLFRSVGFRNAMQRFLQYLKMAYEPLFSITH